MKLSELFLGQTVTIDGPDVEVNGLVYDSRKLTRGSLFAAMPGQKRDGHEYVTAAVNAGASAILCERPVDVGGATRVVAKNARVALALAAKRFFGAPSDELIMVGVTGTNGKTTTTHLVQAILEADGRKTGLIGTLGNKLGTRVVDTGLTTPESVELVQTLREMRHDGAAAVVMEVSSHALDQGRAAGVDYDVAVFTNFTHDHLDYHGSMEAYLQAKSRLFSERLKATGRAVLNYDDPAVRGLVDSRTWTFSARGDAKARVRAEAASLSLSGTVIAVGTPAGAFELRSPLVGRFNVENLLAAASVGLALGIAPEVIVRGVAQMRAVPGRLERVSLEGEALVVVDYAHTPDALEKALGALREVVPSRLVCVFGCGGDRDPHKRSSMGKVAARRADFSVITSDNPRTEDPVVIAQAIEGGAASAGATPSRELRRGAYVVELDRAKAIGLALEQVGRGDGVLIAGKGHETYQIIGSDKLPFDDREVARAVLRNLSQRAGPHSTTGGRHE